MDFPWVFSVPRVWGEKEAEFTSFPLSPFITGETEMGGLACY